MRGCGVDLAEDMPEECKVDGDGAKERADDPGQPEEPAPAGAQGGKDCKGEKAKQEWKGSEIGVVGGLAEFADAVRDIKQQRYTKGRRKKDEQPGGDDTPSSEFEDGARDEKNDCEPAEESFHRMPPGTAVAA
jgi:hypothetical protein